jgi:tRNA pseudouridine38-40 synthase
VHCWKLTLEYEGTRYRGWQEQKGARTVAGELRAAAESLLEGKVGIAGAGRTDAGVHALAQVVRLAAGRSMDPTALVRGLNDRLPPDIDVLRAQTASEDFDPRRDATVRYYLYQISTRRTAFAKKFVWWVRDPLAIGKMQKAAAHFVGRYDFSAFCERSEDQRSTIVVVREAHVTTDGDLILFRIGASHFLWKMVRRLVGTLVEVGRGTLAPDDVAKLIGRPHSRPGETTFDIAAHTAPPSGLFLESVWYDKRVALRPVEPAFPVRQPVNSGLSRGATGGAQPRSDRARPR